MQDQNSPTTSAWGPRLYTFFMYLSDVDEGGHTAFPLLNLTVQPKKGRAVRYTYLCVCVCVCVCVRTCVRVCVCVNREGERESDVDDGGHTAFPLLKLTVKRKRGRAV